MMDVEKYENNDLTEYKSYSEYKEILRTELEKNAEQFVRIGYLLRLATDTDILKESGYDNVNDFAYAEYSLDKSTVSRYINININFSEGGYSDRLREEYRGFGYAKLSLMLTLPASVNAEISPSFSKSEIQSIKEEVESEKELTDLEVMMEGEDSRKSQLDNMLGKALHQLMAENVDVFDEVYAGIYEANHKTADLPLEGLELRVLHEILAPNGENVHFVRMRGIGKVMISCKDVTLPITVTTIRTNEREQFSWESALKIINTMIDASKPKKETYRLLFECEYPEKEEIAPVQQEKEEPKNNQPKKAGQNKPEPKKQEPKKQSKVTKSKPEPKNEVEKEEIAPVQQEEQIPGQDNIMNHPEYLPPEMAENDENTKTEAISEEYTFDAPKEEGEEVSSGAAGVIDGEYVEVNDDCDMLSFKEKILSGLDKAAELGRADMWDELLDKLKEIETDIRRMKIYE